jgi:hypothetical protein
MVEGTENLTMTGWNMRTIANYVRYEMRCTGDKQCFLRDFKLRTRHAGRASQVKLLRNSTECGDSGGIGGKAHDDREDFGDSTNRVVGQKGATRLPRQARVWTVVFECATPFKFRTARQVIN